MKKGEYINQTVIDITGKIDALEEQSSQGSFTPSGKIDILAAATGKLDYPGRVRGLSKIVGLTQFFGSSSQSSIGRSFLSADLIDKVQEQVCQEIITSDEVYQFFKNELMSEIQEEMRSLVSSMQIGQFQQQERTPQNSLAYGSTKGSFNPQVPSALFEPSPTPNDREPCVLYLDDPNMRAITNAIKYTQGSKIHHQKVPADSSKVMVMAVREEEVDSDVPFPSDEVGKLGQAKRYFILWPKRLIDVISPMILSQLVRFYMKGTFV
ncbi:uncharacterized protein LOC114755519 [Neltuma alba]|uniref:uncharacterized protein LOC114755519 n=1 Tax=Neltuma alba TaxID=207710 RepID=UPI0010A4D339|nr:uncharacterized protein LOC114755519 [Prosopis alba]